MLMVTLSTITSWFENHGSSAFTRNIVEVWVSLLCHLVQMLPSKDINFVGYTYKNFEIVNDHEIPGIGTYISLCIYIYIYYNCYIECFHLFFIFFFPEQKYSCLTYIFIVYLKILLIIECNTMFYSLANLIWFQNCLIEIVLHGRTCQWINSLLRCLLPCN